MKRFTSSIIAGFAGALLMVACSNSDSQKETSKPTSAPTPIVKSAPEPQPTATAQVDRGALLYKRCQTCHTLEEGGRNKVGPNLYGIFGAKAGSNDSFNYSKVMKESDIIWTDENLAAYIENPKTFMPKNRMAFVGLRKAEDIELVLEYMRRKMAE